MNPNVIRTAVAVGRRLAAAGREAREASRSVAGPAGEQVIDAVAVAVGEVVRAAVAGAVAAAVRGATGPHPRSRTPWAEDDEFETEPAFEARLVPAALDGPAPDAPEWALAVRAAGAALSVAAGAAAAVPGGRLVAAGLGGLAAVAGLAARAAERTD